MKNTLLSTAKLIVEAFDDSVDFDELETYTLVARKSVLDYDGFTTEYSWYKTNTGNNVFVLGDSELYTPERGYTDFETESDAEAQEWFDSYEQDDKEWNVLYESKIPDNNRWIQMYDAADAGELEASTGLSRDELDELDWIKNEPECVRKMYLIARPEFEDVLLETGYDIVSYVSCGNNPAFPATYINGRIQDITDELNNIYDAAR